MELFDREYARSNGRPMSYIEYHSSVMSMCESLDVARQQSLEGNKKMTSDAHKINYHHIEGTSEDDDMSVSDRSENGYDVNKTARKFPTKTRSKMSKLTMVPAEIYKQLKSSDKQVWKNLSDEGKAVFIKFLSKAPTADGDDNNLSRKAFVHETKDDSKDDDDNKKMVHINTHSVDGENVIYKANNASRSPKDTEGLASRIHTTSDMERYVALVHCHLIEIINFKYCELLLMKHQRKESSLLEERD